MYYSYFGLTQPPFRITPNTEFFYSGGNRGPILEALIYAIGQGEGIIKVSGEVGSGKTMLCSMLQSRLPANVETVYIANPSVTPEEILHAIALELQLNPAPQTGHLEVMQMLHRHLLERHAQDKQVVMFVEESQSMPIATLEEIRLLSNLETPRSKLLQIVLFGQPELDDNLGQPQIRQLRDRITQSFRLTPLKSDEIREYLGFRLRAAGYRGPELFSRSVIRAIARASGGLTRRINLIADKALLAAFSENTHTVKLKHIKAAVRDSEFSSKLPGPSFNLASALSLLAMGAGLGIALFALLVSLQGAKPPAQQPAHGAAPGPVAPMVAITAAESAPATAPQESSRPVAKPAALPPQPIGKKSQNTNDNPTLKLDSSIKTITNEKVGANIQRAAISTDAVENRLQATQTWLLQQDKNTYSIQLLGADGVQQLKNHLNIISKYVEINEIFVYRTVAKEKPSLTLLYGTFNNRRAALDALASLPPPLKAYRPLLRTVQGIRTEIALRQPS